MSETNSARRFRLFSFSLFRGNDGWWRNGYSRKRFLTRMEAWRSGMEIVRQKLDRIQLAGRFGRTVS